MKRHAFRPLGSHADTICRDCDQQRNVEIHYSLFWHVVGEVFELGWGLAWLAIGAAAVIGWVIHSLH